MSEAIKIFAPATVANVGAGFDIMGFAIDNVGDIIKLSLRSDFIINVKNHTPYDIPEDPAQNIICIAISHLLDSMEISQGYDLEILQKVKPGSGMGSSGSSAAAGVYGMNKLLNEPFEMQDLVRFAMEGEKVISLKAHADNVAASLMGGFILIRSYNPLEIIKLKYPKKLFVSLIYPQIEIKTSEAKKLLKEYLHLDQAIQQWGNVGALVHALSVSDFSLLGRSVSDMVAEPVRSMLIPEYKKVKAMAFEMGAYGFNISGSGPTMFALCPDQNTTEKINQEGHHIYDRIGLDVELYNSAIGNLGARIIKNELS